VETTDGVVASALEIVETSEVAPLLAANSGADSPFTATEAAYARSRRDPERRLAARLAAKRAAVRVLGGDVGPADVEVLGRGGPPRLGLSARAEARLRALGADRILVSLTHGEAHAAACVLAVRDRPTMR
jgi:holo-[acyl-carrier protein] synthase